MSNINLDKERELFESINPSAKHAHWVGSTPDEHGNFNVYLDPNTQIKFAGFCQGLIALRAIESVGVSAQVTYSRESKNECTRCSGTGKTKQTEYTPPFEEFIGQCPDCNGKGFKN